MHVSPILAAGWIEAVAPLLLALFWAVRAILEARGQKAARGPDPDVLEEAEPIRLDRGDARRPLAGDPNQPVRNEPARNEIEDFLKRLADESAENDPEPAADPPQRSVEPVAARRESATVGEHVRQHLGHLEESQLAEEASRLGTQVAQRDDQVAARLKHKFDHQLGDLEGRGEKPLPPAPVTKEPTPAEALAAMLASPTGIRDAVLINEILSRPNDRW